MSTSLNPLHEPAWKQEVNRRVAAHMKGKAAPALFESADEHAAPDPGSRAAKAAARVARRFAKAPSYNEVLANEARAAVEAAEAASLAAQEAHAKAQMILAGIEAASVPGPAGDPFWEPQIAEIVPFAPEDRQASALESLSQPKPTADAFAIRWERDLPVREKTPQITRATVGSSLFDAEFEDWGRLEPEPAHQAEIAVIEPALPIPGNLIEFPRQIVATRKVRPRLAEGPLASNSATAQLSIFEVDPTAVSVEPEIQTATAPEHNAEWTIPEWSSIRLAPVAEPEYELLEDPDPQPATAPGIELASLSRRLLAGFVDGALIAGSVLAAAALAANSTSGLPALRTVEIGTVLALLVAGVAYKVLFFTLARATPGMRYARLTLYTFDGATPTRTQRCARLAAVALSILPLGLGFLWAIFDDQHLSWHDRITKTYLKLN